MDRDTIRARTAENWGALLNQMLDGIAATRLPPAAPERTAPGGTTRRPPARRAPRRQGPRPQPRGAVA